MQLQELVKTGAISDLNVFLSDMSAALSLCGMNPDGSQKGAQNPQNQNQQQQNPQQGGSGGGSDASDEDFDEDFDDEDSDGSSGGGGSQGGHSKESDDSEDSQGAGGDSADAPQDGNQGSGTGDPQDGESGSGAGDQQSDEQGDGSGDSQDGSSGGGGDSAGADNKSNGGAVGDSSDDSDEGGDGIPKGSSGDVDNNDAFKHNADDEGSDGAAEDSMGAIGGEESGVNTLNDLSKMLDSALDGKTPEVPKSLDAFGGSMDMDKYDELWNDLVETQNDDGVSTNIGADGAPLDKLEQEAKAQQEAQEARDRIMKAMEEQLNANGDGSYGGGSAGLNGGLRELGLSKGLDGGLLSWEDWMVDKLTSVPGVSRAWDSMSGRPMYSLANDMPARGTVAVLKPAGITCDVFIDCSGSMSDPMLRTIFYNLLALSNWAEEQIARMNEDAGAEGIFEMRVFFWDDEVLSFASCESADDFVKGGFNAISGGGTDGSCVFRFMRYLDGVVMWDGSTATNIPLLDNLNETELKRFIDMRDSRIDKFSYVKSYDGSARALKVVFTDGYFDWSAMPDKPWLETEYNDISWTDEDLLWVLVTDDYKPSSDYISNMRQNVPYGDVAFLGSKASVVDV